MLCCVMASVQDAIPDQFVDRFFAMCGIQERGLLLTVLLVLVASHVPCTCPQPFRILTDLITCLEKVVLERIVTQVE